MSTQALTIRTVGGYFEVLKPRASILLTFIGLCAAIVAAAGGVTPQVGVIAVAIFVASAGANGLTNYLDCAIDANMQRTRGRALPSKRIAPPEKVLPLTISLVVVGLILAWYLHPWVFFADLGGTVAAVVWRKRATCVFPQGAIASVAPVLMGWFAVSPTLDVEILLLSLLIAIWLPVHVWSVMIAHREDYIAAGLTYFPMNWETKDSVKVLLGCSVGMYAASLALYFTGSFGWLYLAAANIMGLVTVYASVRLVASKASQHAWKLYKFSSFPYLGIMFLVMALDTWLRY